MRQTDFHKPWNERENPVKVKRHEILDYETYQDQRDEIRDQVMRIKAPRRIHVPPYLTFLFENRDTIRYQIQEMVRVERMVRESDIQHEIDTYNELLGDQDELGCTLLIEIEEPTERDGLLRRWVGLMDCLYLTLEDGSRAPAVFDRRQIGEERLSSVQYLKFRTNGKGPVAIGIDHPDFPKETPLTSEQRLALRCDLQASQS